MSEEIKDKVLTQLRVIRDSTKVATWKVLEVNKFVKSSGNEKS